MQSDDASSLSCSIDWGDIYSKIHKKLYYYLRRRVSNPDDINDIIQLTFLEAYRNREKFISLSSPETWVFGIANNIVKNYYFRNKKFSEYEYCSFEYLDNVTEGPDFDEQMEKEIMLRSLLDSFSSVHNPYQYQMLIFLLEGASYEEIAEKMNIPIGTVRSRLFRIKEIVAMSLNN